MCFPKHMGEIIKSGSTEAAGAEADVMVVN